MATSETDHAFEVGREYGSSSATWVEIPNAETAIRILRQLDEGDPRVYDELFPSPLSGEWAGESMVELSDRFGLNLEHSDIADAFEAGFSEGFEAELVRACTYQANA